MQEHPKAAQRGALQAPQILWRRRPGGSIHGKYCTSQEMSSRWRRSIIILSQPSSVLQMTLRRTLSRGVMSVRLLKTQILRRFVTHLEVCNKALVLR
jgi:hypothetical protein